MLVIPRISTTELMLFTQGTTFMQLQYVINYLVEQHLTWETAVAQDKNLLHQC